MSTTEATQNTVQQKTTTKNGQQGSTPVATEELHPLEDIVDYVQVYARENPKAVAITCFAVGFVLGWKLKPW